MSHLIFAEGLSESGKTKKVLVISEHDKTTLGTIQWSGAWRQYVFVPVIEYETQWSWDCALELCFHIKTLNEEHKRK